MTDKLQRFLEEVKAREAQYVPDEMGCVDVEGPQLRTLRRMVELVLWHPETGGPSNCSDSLGEHPCGECWACSLRDQMEAEIDAD